MQRVYLLSFPHIIHNTVSSIQATYTHKVNYETFNGDSLSNVVSFFLFNVINSAHQPGNVEPAIDIVQSEGVPKG